MIVLDRCPLDCVERIWPHVEQLLAKGIEAVTTELTTEFILAEALADRRMIWVAFDTDNPFPFLAAASVGQRMTNDGLVVFVDAIGGRDRERWLDQCLAELEAHAKAAGAVKLEMEGRPGWARTLPGYRVARVVLEKTL